MITNIYKSFDTMVERIQIFASTKIILKTYMSSASLFLLWEFLPSNFPVRISIKTEHLHYYGKSRSRIKELSLRLLRPMKMWNCCCAEETNFTKLEVQRKNQFLPSESLRCNDFLRIILEHRSFHVQKIKFKISAVHVYLIPHNTQAQMVLNKINKKA